MSFCYLDVTIGDKPLERIVLKLYDDVTPKTCENFRHLCLGDKEFEGTKLHYKGSGFHRVIKGFMLQAGDFTNHNGTGGLSIWGEKFEDENFEKPCNRTGLLCMANAGKNTNGSQFFITVSNTSTHLTGKHVVFGEVVSGMNAVRAVEYTETAAQDKPVKACKIADCGTVDTFEKVLPSDGDGEPDFPADLPEGTTDDKKVEVAESVRQVGNKAFGAQDFASAINKYEKALRYLKDAMPNTANAADIDSKKVACFSNSALCFLKQKQFTEAQSAASNAVAIDGKNTKALFRRGQAASGLGHHDMAEADFRRVLEIEPGNADATAHLNHALEQQKAAKERLAKNLRKMFD